MRAKFTVLGSLVVIGLLFFGINASAQTNDQKQIIGLLRTIHAAEMDYAAKHVKDGYACNLASLNPMLQPKSSANQIENGKYAGYVVDLSCERGSYKAVATLEHGNGDVFCIDQSGVIRTSAQADACISSGTIPTYGNKSAKTADKP